MAWKEEDGEKEEEKKKKGREAEKEEAAATTTTTTAATGGADGGSGAAYNAGVGSMMNPGRYGIERVAYWLMRLSGLGLLAYFVAHIYETSSILQGKTGWDEFLKITQTTEGHIILGIVIAMCVFHTVNGIRVMLGHGGVGVGRAARPDYPYDPASQNYRHKIGIYTAIVLAALAMMYGMAVMFGE